MASVGSDIFAIVSLLTISLLVLLLLRHYLPLRTTPAYLLLPVFLALALPCSIILLVPIDLASSTDDSNPNRGVWLPERVVLVTWRITYWLTFCLTWFILPLLAEYVDSGYRDTRARVLDSLRRNGRYQLIVLCSGGAGLCYFILQNGFHIASIKGLVMALAYAWGLVLAIGLMGHGIVALPRRLFKNASVSGRLRRIQGAAPKVKEKLDEATEELEEIETTIWQLKQRKHGAGRGLQEWIDELAETTSGADVRPGATAAVRVTNTGIPAVLTERYLAELTRKLKRARHKKARFVNEWATLCQQAQDTQTILDAASSRQLDFGRPGLLRSLPPNVRYHLYADIIPSLRLATSVLVAAAGAIVIFSEVVKGFAPQLSIIGLTVIHHPKSSGSKIGFGGQLISALWLFYMDACALYAISDVRVWGNRALVKRQTYAESACWYSLQVAKLTVPLSYNFITMLPTAIYKDTLFYNFLGQLINLTPLGSGFSAFFPCFILLPVGMTLFNVYGRLKKITGSAGVLEDEGDSSGSGFGTGGWREGRALIEQELQRRGNSAGALGLAARGGSLDVDRQHWDTSGSSTPTRGRQQDSRGPLLPTTNNTPAPRVQEARRQFNAITNREEESGEDSSPRYFYQDFAERVRNTLDTTDRPEWTKGLAKPKWLQNDGQSTEAPWSKWFGGKAGGGGVRL
ncbi:hypothetical protein B0A50_01923 [Salinomyces thailandicus]|uniref:Uncharacterized protein n=1 Tax=Salinomyces thailandicus TaxID=706561 RepID=A0A4U0U9M5_9PEZI|nr:hypothetical protein B0A50_01923 [Salinomyces thailandica]